MPRAKGSSDRKFCTPQYAQVLVEHLCSLAKKSDLAAGAATEQGKDLRAFQALHTSGELVEALAGWAICHTIGLAKDDMGFVPRQPNRPKLTRSI